jgi:hypothetical protein
LTATDSSFQLSSSTPEEDGLGSAYLFVDNSDKETAARLRNALATRKHRKQKLSKVAVGGEAPNNGEREECLEAKSRVVAEGIGGKSDSLHIQVLDLS